MLGLQENEESKVYADEAVKKSEHLKRENDRLRNLSADLSQQVCYYYSTPCCAIYATLTKFSTIF